MPAAKPKRRTGPGRPSPASGPADLTAARNSRRYPWPEWLGGGRRLLAQGRDYPADVLPHAIAQMARNAAVRAGIRLSVTIRPDGGVILVPRGPRKPVAAGAAKRGR